ncbi:DUF924 family protein [Fretibacter rubidus]|uniref:DUF924 family protein n=1 Tax=Fretibacter rubidus TaxID=570162 RepID=UPI00352AB78E
MVTVADILSFWFEETPRARWFNATDAFDSDIRARFETTALALANDVSSKDAHPWEDSADGALAVIIALDQFPRNMYRGTRAAFAWDPLSLSVAKRLCSDNRDLKITQDRRAFVYMPFMHSENLEDQKRCVELVDSRLDDSNTLHHAREHCRVIERFGRFPHRNAILGRDSTGEEIAFLKSGGYAP